MSPFAVAAVVIVVVIAMFALQWWRRGQANRSAHAVGGVVGPAYAPQPAYGQPVPTGSVGMPNPALPPALNIDHRVQSSGPPVQLRICGLPAVIWQHTDFYNGQPQQMQLHLWVDTAVGLPLLHLRHRSVVARAFRGTPVATGIPEFDQRFQASGDVAAWTPILAQPQVQQALFAFPFQTVDVYGGRIAFESLDGVHLDPGAVQGIANIAASLVCAIPPQLTSASPHAPITARMGSTPTDPESVVRNVLAGTELSPQQQEAVMQMLHATEQRRGQTGT